MLSGFDILHLEEYAKLLAQNINFELNAGECLGIIGGTGSGKSTLVQLINRTYHVNKEDILIDGKDINGYEITHLNEQISMVPQESFLFSESIENNIKLLDFTDSTPNIDNAINVWIGSNDFQENWFNNNKSYNDFYV